MLQSSGYLYYDETLVYRSSLSDLDSEAIDELIKSALGVGNRSWRYATRQAFDELAPHR